MSQAIPRSHRLLAAVLVAAPLCEVVEALLSPLRGTSTAADLGAISAHQSVFVASVLTGLAGTVLYVPAFLGLARLAAERSRKLAAVGGALAVASMLGFMGIRMGQAVELQTVRESLSPTTGAALIDHAGANPIGLVLLVMFLAGSVLGVVLLAVALWRSGSVPRPAVVLFAVFPFVDLLTPGPLGVLVSHALLLAGLGWMGLSMLRSPTPAVPAAVAV